MSVVLCNYGGFDADLLCAKRPHKLRIVSSADVGGQVVALRLRVIEQDFFADLLGRGSATPAPLADTSLGRHDLPAIAARFVMVAATAMRRAGRVFPLHLISR
jgi:hypothetical protein